MTCNDPGSLSECVSASKAWTGQKASGSHSVSDNAGNTCTKTFTVAEYECNCSQCHTGENTCKYGCDRCSRCPQSCTEGAGGECHNHMGIKCDREYYDCQCSSCKTGHNTCAYGCDKCYR